ncbi:MAG: hypothetical protein Q8N21_00685 [bacterium]|nr:hypothetical protein [bacterium]
MTRYRTNVEIILVDMETDLAVAKYRFNSFFSHSQLCLKKEKLLKTRLPANLRSKNLKKTNKKRKGG